MALELHLYDFDGTLFRAPDRPPWWGRSTWIMESVSLGPPCVPQKPGSDWWISSAVGDAKRSISNSDVWAILCTGRALGSSHRYRVPELLKQKGLNFDEVYLNPGSDTKSYKIKVILKLLRRFPDIGTVHIWENHLSNMAAFCAAVERAGRICVEHPIKVPGHEPICEEQELIEMDEQGWIKRRASVQRVAYAHLQKLAGLSDDAGADYLSAKLTPMAQAKLLRAFPALHGEVRAEHMTVWYDPPERILGQLQPLIGKKVKLKVVGYAEDEKGQAVVIDTRLPTKNRIPHVTLSFAGGSKAVYSNKLLAHGYQRVVGPTLDAVLTIDQ
jgi:hypothetical protein